MSSSSLYTELYAWLKPFLKQIKAKGFHMSPDTHIQILKVLQYSAEKIDDKQVLFDYVSPLLAKNKEDALLLQSEWTKYCEREGINIPPPPPPEFPYKILIGTTIGIALLTLLWYWFSPAPVHIVQADFDIQSTDVRQPVSFNALKGFDKSDNNAGVKCVWNFGDGTIDSTSGPTATHTYSHPGRYTTSLLLLPRTSAIKITKAKAEILFTLCKPPLQIDQYPDGELSTGQQAAFSVSYDSLYPTSGTSVWQVNGKTVAQNKPVLTWRFDSAGTYTISYIDSIYNGSCDMSAGISMNVKLPATFSININNTGAAIVSPVKVNNGLLLVVGVVLVLSLLTYFFARRKLKQLADENARNASGIISKLKGKSQPYEAPYANHEETIDDEPLMPLLAKHFRRRITDENVYLNIPLTISVAVRSEGFLLPVFTAKTKPAEYLILIDKHQVKSRQVKLFEFLVKRFGKSNVYIDQFYFTGKPDQCFNDYYPKGIYIARLYDLYPDHTVIIFGNGHQFIDRHYPAMDEALALPFTKWNQRAIFTPVPYPDWDSKENILQATFLLLPADLRGQLLLFDFMENPELDKEDCLRQQNFTYKICGINFYSAAKIERYLNDDFLFQWLCAVAISPSIHWEVMLGIGDALQREYRNANIQYSSLLKLVRISWMSDAAFPEETRLELLKKLEPKNEKIAREVMIGLTDEALRKIDQDSFVYEELFMQQMTDKFLLYVHNRADPKYENYKEDYDRFKTLWNDGKIRDTVLKDYLKKEDGGQWSTLIDNQALSNNPASSSSIDRIFPKVTKLQWYKQIALIISCFCLLAGSLAFIFKNKLNGTYIDKSLHLTAIDENATVPFTFSIAFNQCFNAVQMQRDHTSFRLDFGGGYVLTLDGKDSVIQKNIPYALLKGKTMRLHATSSNAQYNFDSTLYVNTNKVSINITGCTIRCNEWIATGKNTVDASFAGDWYNSDIVNGNSETYEPIHIEPRSINDGPINEIFTCSSDPQMQKIITRSSNEGYSLYFLSQTGSTYQMSFAQSSANIESLTEARRDTAIPNFMSIVSPVPANSSFSTSNTFFNTFNGKWSSIDNMYIIDINKTSELIFINKPVPVYLLSKEEVHTTEFSKQLYKVSFNAPGAASESTKTVYLLALDSNRILLSEASSATISDTGNSRLGTFRLLYKQTGDQLPAQLPQSLNEIWHGGTSNRLINFNLAKNVLYYSVNDTKTYGTYGIEQVSLTKAGVYKIITRTNGGYKLFFVRNVKPQSFELSVCQDFAKTKVELENKDESYCDRFNTMALYYENDATKIFYPVNKNVALVKEQRAKLYALDKGRSYTIKHYLGSHVIYSDLSGSILTQSGITWSYLSMIITLSPSPFQRDYDLIVTGPVNYRILWVDDHPENDFNQQAIAFFQKNKLLVETALSNAEAFQKLNSNIYAYIITDIGRNNAERCVVDNSKAGVEFVQRVNFPKNLIFVCAPDSTIERNRDALMNAAIPSGNLTCNMQTTIIKSIASGNTRLYAQPTGCPTTECTPVKDGNNYILFYSQNTNELNPASRILLDEIATLLAKNNHTLTANSFAFSATSATGNQALSQQNVDAVKAYLAQKGIINVGNTYYGRGSANPRKDYVCNRIEITLTQQQQQAANNSSNIVFDTVRNTYLGYKNAFTGNTYENIPIKNLGIVLTLAKKPSSKSAVFKLDKSTCLNESFRNPDAEVAVGESKQIFSACGITLTIKLNSIQKGVAYFDAYVGREVTNLKK